MFAICDRDRPICDYTEWRPTCYSCIAKRKQQRALRQHKKRIHTESVQTQNEEMEGCLTAQSAEIERLQAVLAAFREPDAISDQHLHQLWAQPHNTTAISQLLAVPGRPSARQVNRNASAGLVSGQRVPGATEPPSKLPEQITTECKPKSSSHTESSTTALTASGPSLLPSSQSHTDVVVRLAACNDRNSLTKPIVIRQEQNEHHAVLPDDWLVSRQPTPPRLLRTPTKPESSCAGLSVSQQPAKRFKPISHLSMSGPVRAAETTVTCGLLAVGCTWFCACPSAQQNDGLPPVFSELWDIITEAKVPLGSPRL